MNLLALACVLALNEPMHVRQSDFLWRECAAFGPYRADASSGVPWGGSAKVLGGDVEMRWQSHRLVVRDGPQTIEASCRTRKIAVRRGVIAADATLGRTPLLECQWKENDGGEPWTLSLHAASPTEPETLEGILRSDDGSESIALIPAQGYALVRDGVSIATIETKRVWIDPTVPAPARLRAATVAAAIFLLSR